MQKLPLKKMHALYRKFMEFEEHYGTPENVQSVKQRAANFISKHTKSLKE